MVRLKTIGWTCCSWRILEQGNHLRYQRAEPPCSVGSSPGSLSQKDSERLAVASCSVDRPTVDRVEGPEKGVVRWFGKRFVNSEHCSLDPYSYLDECHFDEGRHAVHHGN